MTIKLPALNSAADLPGAFAYIASAASSGQISAEEAAALSDLVENYRRAIETVELAERIAALEEGNSK